MRSIPLWAALALLLGLASATSSSSSVWQRAFFGRNSRNLRHHSLGSAAPVSDSNSDVGGLGAFDVFASNLNNAKNNNNNNEYGQLFAPFALEQPQQQPQQQQHQQAQQQQAEVYGIVEPLIEDTPCANRACLLNDDCCPSGVCVNTYGEGKCVYVFGRQRDLCQRHADCAVGSACVLVPHEGLWRCEAEAPLPSSLQDVLGMRAKQPLGSECSSSSDCQVINGMCCQQQRLHHRAASKLACGYFRDAFDCVDVAQEHLTSIFQHRRN